MKALENEFSIQAFALLLIEAHLVDGIIRALWNSLKNYSKRDPVGCKTVGESFKVYARLHRMEQTVQT